MWSKWGCDSAGNAPPFYALRVSVDGSGTVSSFPAGINCGAGLPTTCLTLSPQSASFQQDAIVTPTAQPAGSTTLGKPSSWEFKAWRGACAGSAEHTCRLTMDAAKSATAVFQRI